RLWKGSGAVFPKRYVPSHRRPKFLFPPNPNYNRFYNRFDSGEVLVYTDGSCLSNGHSDARAGCAFVFRPENDDCDNVVSFPLEDAGPFGDSYPPTSNRAELRAVIAALRYIDWEGENIDSVVIATDSTYVVNGATDWSRKWVRNCWLRRSSRHRAWMPVANRDLWECLLGEIERWDDRGVTISFWWIPRDWNEEADYWAKDAAEEMPYHRFLDCDISYNPLCASAQRLRTLKGGFYTSMKTNNPHDYTSNVGQDEDSDSIITEYGLPADHKNPIGIFEEARRQFNNEILGGNGRGDYPVNREYSLPLNNRYQDDLPSQFKVLGDRLLSPTAPIDGTRKIDGPTGLYVIAQRSGSRQSRFEPSDPPSMRPYQERASQTVGANAAVSGNGFAEYGANASGAHEIIYEGGTTSQGGEPAANTTRINPSEIRLVHEIFTAIGEGADDGISPLRYPSRPPLSIDTTDLPGQGVRFCLRGQPGSRVIYTSGVLYHRDAGTEPESEWGECAFAFGPDPQPSGPSDFKFRLEDRGPDGSLTAVITRERAALRAIIAALGYRHWNNENASQLIIGTDTSDVIENAISYHNIWMRRESLAHYEDNDLWTLLFQEIDRYYLHNTSVYLWNTQSVPNPARHPLPLFSEPFPEFVPYTG
ncbi:hypothetical protein KEM56_006036, partial [Ascosphaera pollenicola]